MSREPGRGILGGTVGRGGRTLAQLWQVPVFFLGVFVFVATAVTAPLRQDRAYVEFEETVAALRSGLATGERPGVLVAQAENLLARLAQYPRRASEIHFLAGSAYFRLTDKAVGDQATVARAKAIDHLEEAKALGVASEDLYPLLYRLGLSLYGQGKELQRAIDLLAQSVEKGGERPAQGYAVLVQAYLKLPKPNLEAALTANQKQLEHLDVGQVEEVAKARLTRGELLLKKEQRLDALKELDRIGQTAPKQLRFQARMLQTQICEEEGMWRRAIPLWKDLLAEAAKVPGGKGRILYSLGLCYLNDEPPRRDEALAAWKEAMGLGGEPGQAAGLRLGDIKIYGTAGDVKSALEAWGQALSGVRTLNDYSNKLVPLARVQEIFENACRYFLEAEEYERTQEVAELYKRIAAPGLAEERLAQAAEGAARDIKHKAQQADAAEAKRLSEQARTQFHRAGVAYEQAAMVAGEGQSDLFWRSAQCYLSARDFTRATGVLEKFVRLDKNESRLAEGWFLLAEAHVAQQSKDLARQAYYKCIEYPATPFAYRARYQLALDELAQENWDQARAILKQNLDDPNPKMDREAHEKSMYLMGDLLWKTQHFDQASLYLKEATRQYPNNARALEARDLLGECYRRLAEQAEKRMKAAQGDVAKAQHQKTRQKWLEQAALTYQDLGDELESKARHKKLVVAELHLLRKSLFGAADLLFELNEFSQALRRFQALQEKYRQQVEGLIACQRMWRCYSVMRELPEGAKAREVVLEAIKLAQADLEKMDADSPAFVGTGVWRKNDWHNWFRWVSEQIAAPQINRSKSTIN